MTHRSILKSFVQKSDHVKILIPITLISQPILLCFIFSQYPQSTSQKKYFLQSIFVQLSLTHFTQKLTNLNHLKYHPNKKKIMTLKLDK